MFLAFSPSLTFHIVQLDAVDQGQFLDVCQFFRSSACRSPEIMLLLEMVSSIMLQLEVNAEVGEFLSRGKAGLTRRTRRPKQV